MVDSLATAQSVLLHQPADYRVHAAILGLLVYQASALQTAQNLQWQHLMAAISAAFVARILRIRAFVSSHQ